MDLVRVQSVDQRITVFPVFKEIGPKLGSQIMSVIYKLFVELHELSSLAPMLKSFTVPSSKPTAIMLSSEDMITEVPLELASPRLELVGLGLKFDEARCKLAIKRIK